MYQNIDVVFHIWRNSRMSCSCIVWLSCWGNFVGCSDYIVPLTLFTCTQYVFRSYSKWSHNRRTNHILHIIGVTLKPSSASKHFDDSTSSTRFIPPTRSHQFNQRSHTRRHLEGTYYMHAHIHRIHIMPAHDTHHSPTDNARVVAGRARERVQKIDYLFTRCAQSLGVGCGWVDCGVGWEQKMHAHVARTSRWQAVIIHSRDTLHQCACASCHRSPSVHLFARASVPTHRATTPPRLFRRCDCVYYETVLRAVLPPHSDICVI